MPMRQTAPASVSSLICLNMEFAPVVIDLQPGDREGARTDATSYGGGITRMQGGSRFFVSEVHDFVSCRPSRSGPASRVQPLARSNRPRSRSQLRFFSVSRLSCSFLPRASASSTLARPLSLK